MPKRNIFARSFGELRSLRCLVLTALFIAMNITLDLLKLRIDLPGMRIGVGFLTNASIGMLYGPVVCMMMGFCTDILGFLMNPGTGGGGYFPGYTLTAMVAGVIWGLFLYRPDGAPDSKTLAGRLSFPLRTLAARILITLICNVFLNTLWLSLGNNAFLPMLISRLPTQLAYLPVQYLLLLVVLPFVRRLYQTLQPVTRAVAE
ncbi:MAG: folate family ECF transporter S component [Clostridiaceae bacterium]|nr:folate family ECF transporter S component [Clostridiaceae bacterium]